MNHSTQDALWAFVNRYVDEWQNTHQSFPQSEDYLELPSPCVVKETDHFVQWQPVTREQWADFSNVESAMELRLHEDIKAFYSCQLSGDVPAKFEDVAMTLLQVWSDDDLVRLQENIIGHLMTQRRRKLNPTVFIATTDEELDVVSICNLSGEVILERLGTSKRRILASNVDDFLAALSPEV